MNVGGQADVVRSAILINKCYRMAGCVVTLNKQGMTQVGRTASSYPVSTLITHANTSTHPPLNTLISSPSSPILIHHHLLSSPINPYLPILHHILSILSYIFTSSPSSPIHSPPHPLLHTHFHPPLYTLTSSPSSPIYPHLLPILPYIPSPPYPPLYTLTSLSSPIHSHLLSSPIHPHLLTILPYIPLPPPYPPYTPSPPPYPPLYTLTSLSSPIHPHLLILPYTSSPPPYPPLYTRTSSLSSPMHPTTLHYNDSHNVLYSSVSPPYIPTSSLCTSQCESQWFPPPHWQTQRNMIWTFLLSKSPPSPAQLCQNPYYSLPQEGRSKMSVLLFWSCDLPCLQYTVVYFDCFNNQEEARTYLQKIKQKTIYKTFATLDTQLH